MRLAGITIGLALLVGGCGSVGLRPVQTEAGQPLELRETPFFPQEEYQCGPAALATVLAASGVDIAPAELTPKVYLPARKGSLQIELIAAARRERRLPYRIEPDLAALVAELQADRPVLVLQNLGLTIYPVWHYAVVIGFAPERDQIILRSGSRRREIMSVSKFIRTWKRGDSWGLVILRPGELPARPNQQTYLESVAALEAARQPAAAAKAYTAALALWPNNAIARLGLGNAYYAQGDLVKAEETFRQLLALHPEFAVAYNNLAQVLMARGCYAQALAAVDAALAAGDSETGMSAAFTRTRAEILSAGGRSGKRVEDCREAP